MALALEGNGSVMFLLGGKGTKRKKKWLDGGSITTLRQL